MTTKKTTRKPVGHDEQIARVRAFAEHCQYERAHTDQVLKLAVLLFNQLIAVHGFGSYELFLLTCAAILHDIGWIQGQAGHHKAAMQMILEDRTMPLTDAERRLAALIARYHRKALPKPDHAVYAGLPKKQQHQVRFLGGILRIADGLDRSHQAVVKAIEVRIGEDEIEFCCQTAGPALPELFAAAKKADLFELVSGRKSRFVSRQIAPDSSP